MKNILRFLSHICLTVFVLIAHIAVVYLLPFPFSAVNTIFVFLILFLLIRESGVVVWLAFFSHFLLEFYMTTPFGVVLYASTISLLIVFWLYHRLFTNRSWYTALALGALTSLLYRMLYVGILICTSFRTRLPTVRWPSLLQSYFWEFFFDVHL